jgi:glycine hydroxymethyltransferase
MDRLADEHRPAILIAGASAYPRTIDFARFAAAAQRTGAKLVVDMAHIAGLVAAGLHPTPVPHADFVTTTTHKTLRGPRGGMVLCRAEHQSALDRSVFPGVQGGPLMHVIAAKAVCLGEALTPGFVAYQKQVIANAQALGKGLLSRGFQLVSGGTDNHLLLVDLRSKGLTGRRVEAVLERAHITVNKNAIPFDPEKPMVTSGIRVGTPAVTSRGMREADMETIADFIGRAVEAREDEARLDGLAAEVMRFTADFPLHVGVVELSAAR